MLQKNYFPELIDLVQGMAEGEILNKPTITALCIAVEEQIGPLGITPYNIRQIVNMEDVDMDSYSSEEVAQDVINKTYDKSFIKTFKSVKEKDYIKKSRLLGNSNDFLEHMKTFLDGYKPHPAKAFKTTGVKKNGGLVVALTDLHLGKKGSDLIVDRLTEIVDNIVSANVSHVDIFCVGDLVETLVQGGMHDGQIEGMGDMYGFDLLMKTVEVFEDFLMGITTCGITVDFYGLSGNHDRMTKDREGDKSRLGGLVIYELIKRGLMNIEGVDIIIVQDYITTVDIKDIRYIVAHGDYGRLPKRKGTDIAWNHGDNTKDHNVILYGHLHNVSITEEKDITKIGLPGLAGTDNYATKELDLHSEPAYVEITHNCHNSVDVLIKRLAHD